MRGLRPKVAKLSLPSWTARSLLHRVSPTLRHVSPPVSPFIAHVCLCPFPFFQRRLPFSRYCLPCVPFGDKFLPLFLSLTPLRRNVLFFSTERQHPPSSACLLSFFCIFFRHPMITPPPHRAGLRPTVFSFPLIFFFFLDPAPPT